MSLFAFKNDLPDINYYEPSLYSITNSSFKDIIKVEVGLLNIFCLVWVV